MDIFFDTKVYVICPGNIRSGGPELCHQLVSQLIRLGVDAYIFYLPNSTVKFNPENPVDESYVKYHVPYVLKIADDERNILILNESSNDFVYMFRRIRKIIWWMSVDNFLNNVANIVASHAARALRRPVPKFFYFNPADNFEHWVQSEYARQFVTLNGVPAERIHAVSDYLRQDFLSAADKIDLSAKKNIVAFNPLKGLEITQRLMNIAPDIDWRPIQNMTPAEVQALLAAAKVYIDFGNHPGKDRIPREAAISGCVVVTGRRGAAANPVDINIPDDFKFAETAADLPDVIAKIREIFTDFEPNYAAQKDYRAKILAEKNNFASDVAAAFSLIPNDDRDSIAVAQGLTYRGSYIATMLANANASVNFIVDDTFCHAENSGAPFIARHRNSNFFKPKSENARDILIVSTDDAKFLRAEGRIKSFILYAPTQAEIDETTARFGVELEDLLIATSNETGDSQQ